MGNYSPVMFPKVFCNKFCTFLRYKEVKKKNLYLLESKISLFWFLQEHHYAMIEYLGLFLVFSIILDFFQLYFLPNHAYARILIAHVSFYCLFQSKISEQEYNQYFEEIHPLFCTQYVNIDYLVAKYTKVELLQTTPYPN